jgi:diguanylate cyclase (GGDEF)-like protein
LQFLRYIFDIKHRKLLDITSFFIIVIFILAWIFQITGFQDFHETLYLAFIAIISSGVVCVIITFLENKSILKPSQTHVPSAGQNNYIKLTVFIIFALSLVIDFVNFYINPQKINGMFTRASSLCAISLCIIIAIKNILTISEEFIHANAINKIAYNDVLTGLYNRTAYKEHLERITSQVTPNTTLGFVVFDVNNLKYVNDNLGHNYGDELIMSASNIIKESFDDKSITIYRIGGDEFMAIISSSKAKEIYKLSSMQFKTNVHNFNNFYNKPYHLAVAEGVSFFNGTDSKTLTQVIEEADHLMYKNKEEYKKTHPLNT